MSWFNESVLRLSVQVSGGITHSNGFEMILHALIAPHIVKDKHICDRQVMQR